METTGKSPSIQITRPFGGVLLRAVVVLIILLALLEGAARTSWVQNRLEVTSLGNYHYQFEIKWFHLQRYVDAHNGVDVLFLGSSLVNSGVKPEAVNQAWVEKTGLPPLRIFNFGVEGLTIEPNSVVAQLLIETYHPKLIVFGTEIRDYAANNGTETAEAFLSDPWVQYRLGVFSLRGWLAEHSSAYRYFLAYRNWMAWDFAENQSQVVNRTDMLTADGYDVENRVAEDPYHPPDPSDPEDAKVFATFAGFVMAESRLENLEALFKLGAETSTTILVVEMPVTPQFFDYFETGEQAHINFVETISDRVAAAGSYFLPALDESQLPENARSDRVHLSKFGATVFSEYLGFWLADLAEQGLTLRTEELP
jgi:hypothetical protein